MSRVFNDRDKEFGNHQLTHLDSLTVDRIPTSNNELSNEKIIDDYLVQDIILRFNQSFEEYLKISVRDSVCFLRRYSKEQIIVRRVIKAPNNEGFLLQQWNKKCNDKDKNGKTQNFIKL